MLITSKSKILSTQHEKHYRVPHRVLQSSKKIQACVFRFLPKSRIMPWMIPMQPGFAYRK